METRYLLLILEIRAMAERNNILENATGTKVATQTHFSPERAQLCLLWRSLLRRELEIL